MARSREYRATGPIGLRHAVPGLISWSVIVLCVVGIAFFPRTWIVVATAFLGYFLMRMILTIVFAVVGEIRIAAWQRRDWTLDDEIPGDVGFSPAQVVHCVLVPTYKEPHDVVRRTLAGLAAQHRAAERLVVVLATEEREPGAAEKAARLTEEFSSAFKALEVSVHPAGLAGEIAGKSSNLRWAVRNLVRTLGRLGVPQARATVTSCDADSVLHPSYFAAVSRLFVDDGRRYARFWQAPLLYYNNIWRVPAPVRFTTWFIHSGQIAELAMPGYVPLPISTYTFSVSLAEECDWWDPLVISEDWHTFLQCEVARAGDVGMTGVFLPTMADAVEGDGFWSGIVARHRQVRRHAWGAEDAGYLIGEIWQGNCVASPRMLARTVQVLHDHVFRVASWFLVLSAYVLNAQYHPAYRLAAGHALGTLPTITYVLGLMFAAGGAAIVITVLLELRRNPPPPEMSITRLLVELWLMWMLLPVIGLYLGMLPALRAQTRLMMRRPLHFDVTEKVASGLREAS